MIAQGMGGDIVYISSKNSLFAGPNNVAYGAAKADQAHQVRLLAAELGEHGIRVNGINPDGVVRGSGIFAGGWGAQRAAVYGVPEEELGAFYAQRTLLKREVLPEHVAERGVRADRRRPVPHHRPAHPGRRRRRRGLPAMTHDRRRRGRRPRRVQRPGRCVGRGRRRTRLELHEVHRFANGPVRGRRHAALGHRSACTAASSTGCARGRAPAGLDGVGIDRWAVDYGLLDADGALLGNPRALPRRPHRRRSPAGARGRPATSSTPRPGCSTCRSTRSTSSPPTAAPRSSTAARTLLLIPDLLAYWLTGAVGAERHQRLHHRAARRRAAGSWADRPDRRGSACRRRCFPPLREPGDRRSGCCADVRPRPACRAGAGDRRRLARHRVGRRRRARRRPSGSPTSPAAPGRWSASSWTHPVLTEASRRPTSPTRAASTAPSATCATSWACGCCRSRLRTWAAGLPADLTGCSPRRPRARRSRAVVDPDDPAFLPPGDMPARIAGACRRTGQPPPQTPAEMVRCILDSLALAYRAAVRRRAPAVRPRRRRRAPRRRRRPQRAAVPAHRRRLRAAGRGRPGRGGRAGQRPGAGPGARRRAGGLAGLRDLLRPTQQVGAASPAALPLPGTTPNAGLPPHDH